MKNKITIALVVFCFCFGWYGLAKAEFQTEQFLDIYEEYTANEQKELAGELERYLSGIGTGIGWASFAWKIKTICQPGKLAVTGTQQISMLRVLVKNYPEFKKEFLAYSLLRAYEYTFPCNTQEPK
jgi:hypothetical protein